VSSPSPAISLASDANPSRPEAPNELDEKSDDRERRGLGLTGWVLDDGGTAVPGIAVAANARQVFTGRSAPPPQRVVTDGRGMFGFESLPDGDYDVRTEDNDTYERATVIVRAGADSIVLVVKPKSGGSLRVHGLVENTRGQPLDGVRVEIMGQPSLGSVSDPSGLYTLRVPHSSSIASASLRFLRTGYQEQRVSLANSVTPGPDEVIQNVRLEPIDQGADLGGTVRGDDGQAVAGATVELYSASRQRSYRSATDPGGRFALTGIVESDDYRLWVRPRGRYRDRVLENVALIGTGASLEVVVESLGVVSLRGQLVDPSGQPVPGFTMWLTPAYGAARAILVRSDPQGGFAVEGVPEGPAALQTRAAPQLSVSGIDVRSTSPQDLRIPIDVGAHSLEGRLLNADGRPVASGRLSLQWALGSGGLTSRSSRETVSDAEGRFVFTQLGVGPHILNATATGFRGVQQPAVVGPGLPAVEIWFTAAR